jgi:hypothetical protein
MYGDKFTLYTQEVSMDISSNFLFFLIQEDGNIFCLSASANALAAWKEPV